ncbi:ribokinase [Evansella sp. AB-rgal1]|uniref:ribokinase n=1 Tax=Evansella sp. AB-rgal1 TaxID=3242696 RepID=UPI00359D3E0C
MENAVITVIGSSNIDMVTSLKDFPQEGETVIGEGFQIVPGGKGANQAVAASRLGGNVQFIGKVGNDLFGNHLIDLMKEEEITLFLDKAPVSTGVATILLANGNNRIIVTPGANSFVTKSYLQEKRDIILKSKIVVLQFEIPLEAILYCIDICSENNIPVLLNPAPYQPLPEGYLSKVSYITPNETERDQLFPTTEIPTLLRNKVIVTEGEKGVSFYNQGISDKVSGFSVNALDTTGAGDTFNGALAVALVEGMDLKESITFANAAAALSVQKFGAQGGMPSRSAVDDFLQNP